MCHGDGNSNKEIYSLQTDPPEQDHSSEESSVIVVDPVRVSSKMKDAFVSFAIFVIVTILTHGLGGKSPFVLPTVSKVNEGTPVAAAIPNLRTQLAPPPVPFFGIDSAIDDYYGGDIYGAFAEADLHENALIFYYAPWDADSRAARHVLEIVADIFADSDLYIGAVNCWTPKGECYKQFGANQGGNEAKSKPQAPSLNPRLPQNQFPILVFYPRDRKGVQYHGPISVEAIVEFLLSARTPIVHLRSKSELLTLQAKHSGRVMVGYFPNLTATNLTVARKNFKLFLSSAFHFLESDPFRVSTGGFGAVTSQKLATKLHLAPSQPIRYFFWNGTSTAYPNKTISSTNSLVKWAASKLDEAEPLTSWVGVVGRKSHSLSRKLLAGTGNSLLVFIPRINRFIFNEALSIVQETSIQYKFCQDLDQNTKSLVQSLRTLRRESAIRIDSLIQTCKTDPWFLKTFENRPLCKNCYTDFKTNLTISTLNKNIQENRYFSRRKSVLGHPFRDSRVGDLMKMHTRLECTLAHLASSVLKPMSFPCEVEETLSQIEKKLSGLGCSDNRTLNFYTLDYNSQIGLARSLGLDEKSVHALIVNPTEETYYLMKDEFTAENLARFIENFHQHPEDTTEAKLSSGHLLRRNDKTVTIKDEIAKSNISISSLVLEEMSREGFLSSDRSKPLLLLYLAPSCGFCASASRAFHNVRRLMSRTNNILNFSTVDTYGNDLPWSFMAISAPTVIYIPAGNISKEVFHAETRVFPLSKPINTHNLLSFVVANLPEKLRLRLAESPKATINPKSNPVNPPQIDLNHGSDIRLTQIGSSSPREEL